MSRSHIKNLPTKTPEARKAFSLSEEPISETDKTQRFSDDTLSRKTRYTAKHHSFSMSPGIAIERQDSGDAARFIPGAYPTASLEKGYPSKDDASPLSGRYGSRVGSGFMLDEDANQLERSQLPTTEHPSGSRVGVGSLPGSNSEVGVAIFPEERIHLDPTVGPISAHKHKERLVDKPQGQHHENADRQPGESELPTHEHPTGSRVGVGSLPGSNRETGVAILPEERRHTDPIVGPVVTIPQRQDHNHHHDEKRVDYKSQLPTHEESSGSRVGIGSMPGGVHEPGVATLPEERIDGRPYGSGHTGFEQNLREGHPSLRKTQPQHAEGVSQAKSELPTTEKPSGSRIGIGSMPGSIREAGVATLPEERIDGRPYGSGHTGFEDTLGHGHTFRGSHPNENISRSKPKTSKITDDDKAVQALEDKNPCISPSKPIEKRDAAPGPSHSQGLPGDTIFSATQRALAQDPTFTHGTLELGPGIASQISSDGSSSTKSQPATQSHPGKGKDSAKNLSKGSEKGTSHVQQRVHAHPNGPGVLETVEGAALGAMHGAERVLHTIEEGAKAYVPHRFSEYFSGGTGTGSSAAPTEVSQNRQDPVGRLSGPSELPSSSEFSTTSEADGPHSKKNLDVGHGQRVSQPNSPLPQVRTLSPEDKDITDAYQGTTHGKQISTISGTPSKLPRIIKREYHKTPGYDLHGDQLDFSQFLYDDDVSYEEREESAISSAVTSEGQPPDDDDDRDEQEREREGKRDRESGRAQGERGHPTVDYVTEESKAQARSTAKKDTDDVHEIKKENDDVQHGYGGVGYTLAPGKDGTLPGYPTKEGMNKLISERMRDDRLRAAGATNPPKSQPQWNHPQAPSGASAVQGPLSEVETMSDSSNDSDDPSYRHHAEEGGIPIFEDGQPVTSGKFEAVFREYDSAAPAPAPGPQSESESEQVRLDGKSHSKDHDQRSKLAAAAATPGKGKSEALKSGFDSVSSAGTPSKFKGGVGMGMGTGMGMGMKVEYLGKPVSQEDSEELIEIERARRDAVRRMGID